MTCYVDLFAPYRRKLKSSNFESTVNAVLMQDTAVTRNPGRNRAQFAVAVTTRPVHAGITNRSVKMPNDAVPPASLRETGTLGTNCGIVAW